MKNYSDKEKAAIVGVLHAIIYADGFVDSGEIDYIAKLKYDLDISEKAFQEGIDMEPNEAFSIISAMDELNKNKVGEMLIKMVYSDGELDSIEYSIAAGIMLKCGIAMETEA